MTDIFVTRISISNRTYQLWYKIYLSTLVVLSCQHFLMFQKKNIMDSQILNRQASMWFINIWIHCIYTIMILWSYTALARYGRKLSKSNALIRFFLNHRHVLSEAYSILQLLMQCVKMINSKLKSKKNKNIGVIFCHNS